MEHYHPGARTGLHAHNYTQTRGDTETLHTNKPTHTQGDTKN